MADNRDVVVPPAVGARQLSNESNCSFGDAESVHDARAWSVFPADERRLTSMAALVDSALLGPRPSRSPTHASATPVVASAEPPSLAPVQESPAPLTRKERMRLAVEEADEVPMATSAGEPATLHRLDELPLVHLRAGRGRCLRGRDVLRGWRRRAAPRRDLQRHVPALPPPAAGGCPGCARSAAAAAAGAPRSRSRSQRRRSSSSRWRGWRAGPRCGRRGGECGTSERSWKPAVGTGLAAGAGESGEGRERQRALRLETNTRSTLGVF